MPQTITGTVEVKRIAELLEKLTAIGDYSFIIDKSADSDSYRITFDTLVSLITHNSVGGKQGGTTNEYYHLTAAERTLVQALSYQVVAEAANLPSTGNPSILYYAISENTLNYWNGATYTSIALGGGDVSYNDWTVIAHGIMSKHSDTTILVTGVDWTFMLGGALGLNVGYGTHIVKGAVFAGGNTTLTVVGSGVVPASITSAIFANHTRVKKEKLFFNYGTFNSGSTTNVLTVYGNNIMRYDGQPARLLYFHAYSPDYGTVGSGSINSNIDGGSALFSSSLLLSGAVSGVLNSGTSIQNNALSGLNNDIRFTNPVAKGSDDGDITVAYIEYVLD